MHPVPRSLRQIRRSVPATGLPTLLLAVALTGSPALGADDEPRLVRDIETTGEAYVIPCHLSACPPPTLVHGALLSSPTPLGDLLVFEADDRIHGIEPWVTDGTAAGTRMLADVSPGPDWSEPTFLGTIGDQAFFWARSGQIEGLWATDGSPEGTGLMGPVCDGCSEFEGTAVASYDGNLFFQLYVQGAGRLHLYRTDGAQSEWVASLCEKQTSLCLDRVRNAIEWDGSLYFDSVFANNRPQVYRLDGASSSPVQVDHGCAWRPDLLPRGDELWFVGTCHDRETGLDTGLSTAGLYRTDRPAGGPTLIRSFGSWSSTGTPPQHQPMHLTGVSDETAAFVVGDRIWITDGTEEGTEPGPELDAISSLSRLGDQVLVAGTEAGQGGVWALDVTGALAELARVTPAGGFHVVGDRAYFAADDGQHGFEPWITDGSAAGTRLLGDVAPGPASSNPGHGGLQATGFVAVGDDVFFAADDSEHDIELWAVAADVTGPAPTCVADPWSLCLQDGRFEVEVSWTDFGGKQGVGRAIPQTSDTGSFWFFNAKNHELVVKVLDGRVQNDSFWVFYGSLTNVEFTLVVTDTETDRTWTRTNPLHEFASGGDVDAFPETP